MSEARVQINLNPEARLQMQAKVAKAVQDVFQLDILPEAVRNSPVTPEGMAHNQAKFDEKHHREGTTIDPVVLKGTGHNRQSLDVEFETTSSGPKATLFGQSGYSGYLEVGTSKMRAQPYIYPAWLKFKDKIFELLRKT